jgi:hypothetical protein
VLLGDAVRPLRFIGFIEEKACPFMDGLFFSGQVN